MNWSPDGSSPVEHLEDAREPRARASGASARRSAWRRRRPRILASRTSVAAISSSEAPSRAAPGSGPGASVGVAVEPVAGARAAPTAREPDLVVVVEAESGRRAVTSPIRCGFTCIEVDARPARYVRVKGDATMSRCATPRLLAASLVARLAGCGGRAVARRASPPATRRRHRRRPPSARGSSAPTARRRRQLRRGHRPRALRGARRSGRRRRRALRARGRQRRAG